MNVLAVVAHPDDMEFYCAGTLSKCVKRGDKVIVCHASSGNLGSMTIPPAELSVIRANEAKSAGALAGVEVIWGGFDDLQIYDNNREARDKIVDIIRYANPDFIITHYPEDYMPDHTAVSRLVFDASFAATLPNYTDYPHKYSSADCEPAKLCPIYYMTPSGGLKFHPTDYVDVTDEMDLKVEMSKCHKSQLKWLKEHDNNDSIDRLYTVAKFRGMQCGAKYAEAFSQCRAYLKGTDKRLLP